MPKAFYDGTTGIPLIDSTIHKLLRSGYNHHIERLMVSEILCCYAKFIPTMYINGSWKCILMPTMGDGAQCIWHVAI
jgi:Tfp pilus tip-associated adhesin PilY1